MLPTWPLVGRDDELELIEEVLGRSSGARSMVIAGMAGVGKTRLAGEALEAAARSGSPTARIVASRAASTIPLGALVPLLADNENLPDSRLALLRQAAQSLAARATPSGSLVLALDDAHLLDDASAALMHQLAVEGTVRLLLTVRTGEPLPDAIAVLWKDGLAERLELQRLARTEVEALVAEALEGAVDGALVQHLWTTSQGNALYLRELILGGLEAGVIRRDGRMWRLRGELGTRPRLAELVEGRLGALSEGELAAVDLLAIGDAIGLETLESAAGAEAIDSLERRGLILVEEDGRRCVVRLAHPLYGEARRRSLPAIRTRNEQRRVAELIEGAGARRRDDVLRVAMLRLDADGQADPALLAEAAQLAWFTYDIVLEERLARAAVAAGAGVRSVLLLAEILRWTGRQQEAENLLAPVTREEAGDDATFAVICLTRAWVLFRGLDHYDLAVAVIDHGLEMIEDPAWKDELRAERASLEVFAGEVMAGLAVLEPLFETTSGRAFVAAAGVGVAALVLCGRADEALVLADRGFGVCLEIGRQPSMSDPAIFVIGRCLALVYVGRLDEADTPAQLGYDWSITTGVPAGQAWFGMILALVAVTRGDLERAADRFEEAALGFRDQHDRSNWKWCVAGVAWIAALRGDPATARRILGEVDAIGMRSVALMDTEVERARAATEAAEGDLAGARRRLLAAAGLARGRGLHALEAGALHDLVRLGISGRDKEIWERLDEAAMQTGGPLPEVRRDHAAALVAMDARALEAVADAYEKIGARLYAAEAAGQAAVLHRRCDQEARAMVAATRCRTLADACGGAVTPAVKAALQGEHERASRLGSLTPRELEVARLAAAGQTNRQIAECLFVSIRTVENQLQRTYSKLRVRGRADLASAFAGNE